MMLRKFALLAALMAAILTFVRPAQAELVMCNDSDHEVIFSYVMKAEFQFMSDTYDSSGWYTLGFGCQTIQDRYVLASAFILLAKKTDTGHVLLGENDILIDEVKASSSAFSQPRAALEKAENSFCVSFAPFEKRNLSKASLRNCAEGETMQPYTFWFKNATPDVRVAEVVISNRGVRLSRR